MKKKAAHAANQNSKKKTSGKSAKTAKAVKTAKAAKPIKAVKTVKTSKIKKADKASNKKPSLMVQHLFRLQGNYKAPDGRVFRVVISEVYNLRCFEVVNGNLVGPMIKIHPTSDLAKSLVEVSG